MKLPISTFANTTSTRMTARITILLVGLMLSFSYLRAQSPDVAFKHLTTAEGSAINQVYTILQDHRGFMWFGTELGLKKYDGVNFTTYRNDVADSLSLGNSHIKGMIEDSEQNLWMATFGGGLNLYNRFHDHFTVFRNKVEDGNSLSSDYTNSLFEDSNKDIWVGTINGLNKFDKKTKKFTRYFHDPKDPSSISSNTVAAIYEDKRGNLWVGTSGGLNLMDRTTGTFTHYTHQPDNKESISHNYISQIVEDKAGNLWVGTRWDGLNKFDYKSQTFTRYRNNGANPGSIGNDEILAIHPDKKGNLWVGTAKGGLNFYDAAKGIFIRYVADFSNKNSLSSGAINAVFEDNSGTLWVATTEGINYFNPVQQKFQVFKHKENKNSISGNKIRSFSEDSDGNIWIGVDGGGLNLYNRTTHTFQTYAPVYNDPNSLSNHSVLAVMYDSHGELWVGTYDGGLDRFDIKNNKFTHYKHDAQDSSSIANNTIKAIIEDSKGNIWIGTNGGGLNRYNRNTNNFTRFPCGDGKVNCWINSLFEDSDGNIWISSNWGLSQYNPASNTFSYFIHEAHLPNSLSSNDVFATYQDRKGRIWVATKYGLNLLEPESRTFKAFYKEDGLPSNSIMSINEDSRGNLWLGTMQGLSAFNPDEKTVRNYSPSVGVQGEEFSVGATYKTKRGELLLGGSSGFNLFHPDSLKDNSFAPPVFLTSFAIFNKPVRIGENSFLKNHINEVKEITLSYLESVFSFEYAALNYVDGNHNEYAYMMEGFDKDWNYVGTEKKATYTNLNPGEYSFRVKASNNDGVWNEEGTALSIIITPPYWQTWWFRALVALGLIGGAFTFYQARMNAVKAQKEELERQVQEKTADIQKANNDLTERQEEILQQQEELQAQAEILQQTNDNLRQTQEEIAVQRDHLKIVNEQVMSSITYARTIQKAILPSDQKIDQAFPEHFIIYRPKDVVSGDFYWFAHLPKEESGLKTDISFMAVVDCTGHGVPGAFMSIIGSTILNEIVKQKQITDPAQILEQLHLGVKEAVEKAEGLNTAGMDVCLCRIEKAGDSPEVKIFFSGAKRNLLFVKSGTNEVEKLLADRRSIGSESSTPFSTQELVLGRGSMLYFTSDGYADQNNPAREKLGSRKVNLLFSDVSTQSVDRQKQLLETALDEHQQEAEQRDDITLLGIRL